MQSKKYLLLLFVLVGALINDAHAQYNPYWQWAKADTPNAKAVQNTASVLAVKNGKALWGRMTRVRRNVAGEVQGDYSISEYDSTGRQLTSTVIIGNVQLLDAQADNLGNWYILGKFYDTAVFTNGTNLFRPNPTTNPDPNHFMVRYNSTNMSIGWVKTIGPLNTVSARSFTLDINNIYLAADSLNSTVIRRMTLTNGIASTMLTQNGASTSTSIQMDAQGNIYLAGSCATGVISFNGPTETGTPPEFYDYIVKYKSNGAHVWHQWMRDDYCLPRKLTLFNDRFLYYTGNYRDSFFVGGVKVGTPTGPFDYVVARLDTSGTGFWARHADFSSFGSQVSFTEPYHAVVMPDTAVVIFPQVSGYVNWGNSIESHLLGYATGSLISIGADNNARWTRPILAQYSGNQHIATEGTAIWVTGDAYTETGTVQFDTLNLKMPVRKYVPFLARTKMIRPIPVVAGVNGIAGSNISVYPVPVRTTIIVDGLRGSTDITLSDISGRIVRQINAATTKTTIDVADLPRGAYVIDLRTSEGREVRRVVLQ